MRITKLYRPDYSPRYRRSIAREKYSGLAKKRRDMGVLKISMLKVQFVLNSEEFRGVLPRDVLDSNRNGKYR